jgi:hypothetical protein
MCAKRFSPRVLLRRIATNAEPVMRYPEFSAPS